MFNKIQSLSTRPFANAMSGEVHSKTALQHVYNLFSCFSYTSYTYTNLNQRVEFFFFLISLDHRPGVLCSFGEGIQAEHFNIYNINEVTI